LALFADILELGLIPVVAKYGLRFFIGFGGWLFSPIS
jgi:hypothetical protein